MDVFLRGRGGGRRHQLRRTLLRVEKVARHLELPGAVFCRAWGVLCKLGEGSQPVSSCHLLSARIQKHPCLSTKPEFLFPAKFNPESDTFQVSETLKP